jgi:hypothetical protein
MPPTPIGLVLVRREPRDTAVPAVLSNSFALGSHNEVLTSTLR